MSSTVNSDALPEESKEEKKEWMAFMLAKCPLFKRPTLEKKWRQAKRIAALGGEKHVYLAAWHMMFQLCAIQIGDKLTYGASATIPGACGVMEYSGPHHVWIGEVRVLIPELYFSVYEQRTRPATTHHQN